MPTPTAGNVIAPIKPAVVNQAPIVGDTGTGLIGQAATYTPTDGTATANLTGTGYPGRQRLATATTRPIGLTAKIKPFRDRSGESLTKTGHCHNGRPRARKAK